MKKIAPQIDQSSADFLAENFRSLNFGATYVLDAFRPLYRHTLDHIRKHFARGELMLMLDCMNGTALTAGFAGQHLQLNVYDAMKLDGLDKKWGVNRARLNNELESLTIFERACIEIWANGFWYGGPGSEGRDIEEYVAALT